jgi:hypothetical protein
MESRLFRAVVTKVVYPTGDNANQIYIYITDTQKDFSTARDFIATPPSTMPINDLGTGMFSAPQVGTECLVVSYGGSYHILTYIPKKYAPAAGYFNGDPVVEGEFVITTQGYERATFSLKTEGVLSYYVNNFANVYLDGQSKSYVLKSLYHKTSTSTGYTEHTPPDENEVVSYVKVITQKIDDYSANDLLLGVEEARDAVVAGDYAYVDKIIQRSGKIGEESHLYEWDARQSRGVDRKFRNISTYMSFGMRSNSYPGALHVFRGKKNHLDAPETYFTHIGRNSETGEAISRRAYVGFYKKFGNNLNDGLGEGKGYSLNSSVAATQVFSESFGILLESDDDLYKNSLFRTQIALDPSKLTKKEYKNVLFSQNKGILQYTRLEDSNKNVSSLMILRDSAEIYEKTLKTPSVTQKTSVFEDSEKIYVYSLTKGQNILTESFSAGQNTYNLKISADSKIFETNFSKSSGSVVFSYTESNKTEKIQFSTGKVRINLNTSAFIEINETKIILSMKDSVLELTEKGLTYNGKPLVFGALVDWIDSSKSQFALSGPPGSPSPIHPSAMLGILASQKAKHTQPAAFKTITP